MDSELSVGHLVRVAGGDSFVLATTGSGPFSMMTCRIRSACRWLIGRCVPC